MSDPKALKAAREWWDKHAPLHTVFSLCGDPDTCYDPETDDVCEECRAARAALAAALTRYADERVREALEEAAGEMSEWGVNTYVDRGERFACFVCGDPGTGANAYLCRKHQPAPAEPEEADRDRARGEA